MPKAQKKVDSFELQVLNQLPTPVMAVDTDLSLTFLNSSGCKLLGKSFEELKGQRCCDLFKSKHCGTENCCMKKAMADGQMHSARNEFTGKEGEQVHIEYFAAPLKDKEGEIVGGLEYIVDITERVEDEIRLTEQNRTIRELSTPTIKLWDGILVLPVVGVIDSTRAQYMMESMLEKILETSSRVIILDIHGVAAVDTAVANHLLKITKATKLMGCECLLSGISPAVAQTIIQLGVDMTSINTHSTLSDALERAFRIKELKVSPIEG